MRRIPAPHLLPARVGRAAQQRLVEPVHGRLREHQQVRQDARRQGLQALQARLDAALCAERQVPARLPQAQRLVGPAVAQRGRGLVQQEHVLALRHRRRIEPRQQAVRLVERQEAAGDMARTGRQGGDRAD